MFFVFGWGRQTVKKHGPVQVYHCEHCNNNKTWQLYSRKTWFTLFFIPIIPYSNESLLLCPVCSHGVKIDKDKFNELKTIAQCNMDLINKKITEEEHSQRMKLIKTNGSKPSNIKEGSSENNLENNSEIDLEGKTETQKNYIRQMNEIRKEREKTSSDAGVSE